MTFRLPSVVKAHFNPNEPRDDHGRWTEGNVRQIMRDTREQMRGELPPDTQKRAAAGGELGPNGEWYPGGAWIATQDVPKRIKDKLKKSASRGVEVEPYGKREVPKPGQMSIYDKLKPGWFFNPREMDFTRDAQPWQREPEESRAVLEELLAKFKAGERWVNVNDYPGIANLEDVARLYVAGMAIPGDALKDKPDEFKNALAKYQPSEGKSLHSWQVKAPWDERKHPRDGGKFSSGPGTTRHNPDLDAAFAAPAAHHTPKPSHHDPRHNPDLDAIFGESKPHHDEHHWRPAHELLDEMDKEKPKLPTALPIAQHAPPEKPRRSPFSNVRAAGRKKPGFQAPGTGKAPTNLGSPAHEGEARDQLIWLLGRASRLRQQGRESGGLKPHHARQLTLAVNLASRLRHAYFNPDDAAKSKPKGFTLPYRVKAIFEEGKHPRDAGRWASKPGASGKPKKRNTWTAADAAEMERERARADAYFAAHRTSATPKTRTRDEHIAHLKSAISGEAKDRDISGYTLPENATEVGHQALAALHDHFQEKRAGLRIDELHKKSGTTATPEHFAAVLHKLDEAGHVRLGGYSGAIQDHPDPAHLHMMGAKVIGMVHPGDGPKPKGWQESRHRRGQPENAGQFGSGGGRGPSMAKPSHIAFVRTLQQARSRIDQHSPPAGGSGPAAPKVPPPPEGVTEELRGLAGDSSWPKVAHAFAKLYTAVFVKATELGMLTTKVAEAIGDTTEDYMTGRAGTYGSVDAWKGQTGISWSATMAVVRLSIAAAFKAAGKGKEHEDIEAAVKLTVEVLNHVHETFGVSHEVDEDEVRELLTKRLEA